MPDADRFAEIAHQAHPLSKDSLATDAPLPIDAHDLPPSSRRVDRLAAPSYEQQLAHFHRELAALEIACAPFLADHTPPPAIVRLRQALVEFSFRYETADDRADFQRVLSGRGAWETVRIPDYRGPIGRWTGFYRCTFSAGTQPAAGHRLFLRFLGVDYIARVYVNGRCVGSHEGFFAPFEFDVTDGLRSGSENTLVVVVENDAPTVGLASWDRTQPVDGDKLYAATGPGWDDPVMGWHHCPPGAGIYNHVYLEERAPLFVQDVFARPDLAGESIEAWIEVMSSARDNQPLDLRLAVYPRNFDGPALEDIRCALEPAGPGANCYRVRVPLPGCRVWSPAQPWLYTLRATVMDGGAPVDQMERQFGMRSFHMDEAPDARGQRGTLYLNSEPVILRGANDMGHMQLCVMRGDMDQLVEDILIAKLANMNYYRVTQRPVQEDIYDYFDRLGMMSQTDLPLFGYLRRNQFSEAVRQVGEMERLIRSHPSSIMVSYVNEPFNVESQRKSHRHLNRTELEGFFAAATAAVHVENPDRVVKHVEGDYDPPTADGLSDFHCYNMWYTNHALPIGRLHRGYLPPLKRGWKTGCGEYGTEGLDPLDVMLRDYPKQWLPADPDGPGNPDGIVRAQTFTMHGDWFEEQPTLRRWIAASQAHQARATTMMTDALRLRSDRVISTAVHLLIDAWPAGWMKALVDHRRTPKPGYFALQASLAPVRVHLRSDRRAFYGGEQAAIETWLLNDTPEDVPRRVAATVYCGEQALQSFEADVSAGAVSPTYAGTLRVKLPEVAERQTVRIEAALLAAGGKEINRERLDVDVFARAAVPGGRIACIGDDVAALLAPLGLSTSPYRAGMARPDCVVCSTLALPAQQAAELSAWAQQGTRLVFLCDQVAPSACDIAGLRIAVTPLPELGRQTLTFVARDAEDARTRRFRADDFSFWYNAQTDCIDDVAQRVVSCDGLAPLVFTYHKPGFFDMTVGTKKRLPVVGAARVGKGELIVSTLCLPGRIGHNPVLDHFLLGLLA